MTELLPFSNIQQEKVYVPEEDVEYFKKILRDNGFKPAFMLEDELGGLYRFMFDFATIPHTYHNSSIAIRWSKDVQEKTPPYALIPVDNYQHISIEAHIILKEYIPIRFPNFGKIEDKFAHHYGDISHRHLYGDNFSRNDFKNFIEAVSNRIKSKG